jgi:N-acyl-phosphatidylethanolamine-hydrolysing phospholipase D
VTPPPPPPSHHRPGGGFHNPWISAAAPAFSGVLKWWLVHRTTHPRPEDPPASAFPVVPSSYSSPRARPSELTITWIGHSTTLVQMGGLNILTDPMWSARAAPFPPLGPRRWVRPGVPLERLPPIDVVLQSHNHYDHLDSWTVRRLARAHPNIVWVAPLGVGRFLRSRGARHVHELDWWQEIELPGVRIAGTPAQHFSGRGFGDRGATLWCGWALASTTQPARRVFFAGDTGFHPAFSSIAQRYGPFDIVLLPVGAYEPRWFMRYVHMNPEEAIEACKQLAARAMVPIHWGTFKLTDEAMDEPPVRARAAWVAQGLPPEGYRQLAHGQTLTL